MHLTRLTSRIRPLAAGAAMIGFVATLELEDIVDPVNLGSTAERLHAAAAHPGRLFAAAALMLIACALVIPTALHTLRLVRTRGRGTVLASLAAACLTVGAVGHGAIVGYYAMLSAAAQHQTAAVVSVFHQMDTVAIAGLIGVGIAAFALGCLLLIGALVRARIATRWLLLAIPAAIVGHSLGQAIGIRAFDLGQLAAVAPLVWLGWRSGAIMRARSQDPLHGLEPALST